MSSNSLLLCNTFGQQSRVLNLDSIEALFPAEELSIFGSESLVYEDQGSRVSSRISFKPNFITTTSLGDIALRVIYSTIRVPGTAT